METRAREDFFFSFLIGSSSLNNVPGTLNSKYVHKSNKNNDIEQLINESDSTSESNKDKTEIEVMLMMNETILTNLITHQN